jgi:major vault protein
LYPYEELYQEVKSFVFLKDNEALILQAVRPFIDEREDNKQRFIDDEYIFKGPGNYIPRIEESVKSRIEAIIVLPNNALLIKAKKDTVDGNGKERKAGETVRNNHRLLTLVVVASQNRILHADRGGGSARH